jgi:hypothetical protein
MPSLLTPALLAGALLVLTAVGAAVYGNHRWAAATAALRTQIEAAATPPSPAHYDARELAGLPAPVQRYFRAVLTDGQAVVRAVTLEHAGRFNMSEAGEQWKPFTSTQRVVTARPGFVWDGRIAMLPGLNVHVHDAYVAGSGLLHAAALGLITLADIRGSGDEAQGELMRFFAEAPWYPTALLPSQGVRWQAVDERSARATLSDGPVGVSLLWRFDAGGLIESVRAEARARTVGKTLVMTPWEGRWSDYQVAGGMRVPMKGEVAWLLPAGPKPYWRGQITALRHQFAD